MCSTDSYYSPTITSSHPKKPSHRKKTPCTTLKSGTNIILKKSWEFFVIKIVKHASGVFRLKPPGFTVLSKTNTYFWPSNRRIPTPWCHELHCFGVSLVSDLPRSEDGFPNLCQVWGDPKCSTWYSLGLTMLAVLASKKNKSFSFSTSRKNVIYIFRNKQVSNLSGALSSNLEPKGDIFLALIQDLQVEEWRHAWYQQGPTMVCQGPVESA